MLLSVSFAVITVASVVTLALIVAAICVVVYVTPKLPAIAQYVVYGLIVLLALVYVAIKLGIAG